MFALFGNHWAKLLPCPAQQLYANFTAFLGQNTNIALTTTPATSTALSTATALLTGLGIDVVSSQLSLLVLSGYALFYFWFAEILLQHSYSYYGCGAYSKAGPSRGGRAAPSRDESDSPKKSTSKKRKRDVKGEGKANNNSDEDSGDDMAVPPPADKSPKPLLACPFFRLNPFRYVACADCDLRGYDAVKQHMARKHREAFYCPICFSFFKTAGARDTHIRGGCTDVPGHDIITETEWDSVFKNPDDKCPRTNDDIEKYLWMWPRLFRDHTPPIREEVYLQDIVVEVKKLLYSPGTILSVLETRLPLNQPATPALAEAIREGLLAADAGPRLYRVYHPSNDVQTNNGEGPSGSSSTHSGPQLGHGDASSSVVGGPSVIAGPSASAGMSAQPTAAEDNPSSAPPPATTPGAADDDADLRRTVIALPLPTMYDAWANVQHYALSPSWPDGPRWDDVGDYTDIAAWEAAWAADGGGSGGGVDGGGGVESGCED